MLFRLFRRNPRADTISALYGAIVAQARRESFYLGFGVPDTVEGRFDMIVLHLALFCRRLTREGGPVHALGQDVFDLFCRDMDHNLPARNGRRRSQRAPQDAGVRGSLLWARRGL